MSIKNIDIFLKIKKNEKKLRKIISFISKNLCGMELFLKFCACKIAKKPAIWPSNGRQVVQRIRLPFLNEVGR